MKGLSRYDHPTPSVVMLRVCFGYLTELEPLGLMTGLCLMLVQVLYGSLARCVVEWLRIRVKDLVSFTRE